LFAVELVFDDGVSPDELIVVRRQSFVLGSTQDADVMLEGSSGAISPIRIERRRGRRFAVIPLEDDASPQFFSSQAEIKVGEITLRVMPIDIDLVIATTQSPEFSASDVLSRAMTSGGPEFPALEVIGASSCVVSFAPDQELLVGRSRNCAVRLDEPGLHPEHAKIGYFGNSNALADFWFEPVVPGDSFIPPDRPINSRVEVSAGDSVVLSQGRCSVRFLAKEEEKEERVEKTKKPSVQLSRYPCIVSKSDLMRPDRYPLSLGRRVSIGRDPSNEIWFNVSHVSRLHAELTLTNAGVGSERGTVSIIDHSSNGTFIDGVKIPSEVERTLPNKHTVIDLSKGISLAVCFTAEEEEEYLGRKPAPARRVSSLHGQILSQIQIPLTPFNSDEENSLQSERPSWFSQAQFNSQEAPNSDFGPPPAEAFHRLSSSDSTGKSAGVKLAGDVPESRPIDLLQGYNQSPGEKGLQNFGRIDEESAEEFAPQKKFGFAGRVLFWGAFLVLVVVNYFAYLGK